jgi:hypothetical protein
MGERVYVKCGDITRCGGRWARKARRATTGPSTSVCAQDKSMGERVRGLCYPMSPNARDMRHPFICGGRWARKAREATTGPSTSVAAATFAQGDKSMAEKGCARLRAVLSHVPKMRGTWGTRSFVVSDGREKPEEQPQVLRLRSLRRSLRDKSMAEKGCARLRAVPSHVPKCEGHGAPVHLWWAMGAKSPRSNRRFFVSCVQRGINCSGASGGVRGGWRACRT